MPMNHLTKKVFLVHAMMDARFAKDSLQQAVKTIIRDSCDTPKQPDSGMVEFLDD